MIYVTDVLEILPLLVVHIGVIDPSLVNNIGLVLWHIKLCWLFNAKSIFM